MFHYLYNFNVTKVLFYDVKCSIKKETLNSTFKSYKTKILIPAKTQTLTGKGTSLVRKTYGSGENTWNTNVSRTYSTTKNLKTC